MLNYLKKKINIKKKNNKTLVPANKVHYLPSSLILNKSSEKGSAFLITGIDSPVSVDSFITQEPLSKIISQDII